VQLVGFTIEIHYDARPYERQIMDRKTVTVPVFSMWFSH